MTPVSGAATALREPEVALAGDLLPERRQRGGGQLEVRDAERDGDDRQESRQPVSRWESASHQPASRNQSTLPTTPTPTPRGWRWMSVLPNGQSA